MNEMQKLMSQMKKAPKKQKVEKVEKKAPIIEVKPLDAAWYAEARRTVIKVARQKLDDGFTSDDVWEAGLPKPSNPRALGPVMKGLAGEGELLATGRYVLSKARKSAPVMVWKYTRT